MSGAEISVRLGKPHHAIASVAKEWDADLVILGAYRKHSGDQFLGTTAERLVRAAIRPVLIVNGEARTPYESVLLASDLSDEFAQVAHMTQDLGLLENARVSLVHALEPASREMLYIAGVTEPYIVQYLQSVRQCVTRDASCANASRGPGSITHLRNSGARKTVSRHRARGGRHEPTAPGNGNVALRGTQTLAIRQCSQRSAPEDRV